MSSHVLGDRATRLFVGLAAFVITVASTIVFGRVIFEVAVVAPELLSMVISSFP